MLCYVMLCCVMLCYVVLCGVVWCGIVWCGVVWCCVVSSIQRCRRGQLLVGNGPDADVVPHVSSCPFRDIHHGPCLSGKQPPFSTH